MNGCMDEGTDGCMNQWMDDWVGTSWKGDEKVDQQMVSELARGWTADEEMDGCLMDGGPIRDAG